MIPRWVRIAGEQIAGNRVMTELPLVKPSAGPRRPARATPARSGPGVSTRRPLFFAFLVLLILGGVIVSLVMGAWPALSTFGFGFVTTQVWNPVTEKFGALAPIYGTLVTSLIAHADRHPGRASASRSSSPSCAPPG